MKTKIDPNTKFRKIEFKGKKLYLMGTLNFGALITKEQLNKFVGVYWNLDDNEDPGYAVIDSYCDVIRYYKRIGSIKDIKIKGQIFTKKKEDIHD
jgi:hypothetical protein